MALLLAGLAAGPALAGEAPGESGIAERELPRLPIEETVSQYGINWTFDKPVPVGRFVNGDYYVVGPATIVKISPRPLFGQEARDETERERREDGQYARNGAMLILPSDRRAGFDSRIINRYDPSLFARLPIKIKPGDSLIPTISMKPGERIKRSMRGWLTSGHGTPVKTATVLSCLEKQVPPDAFRPSYCDTSNKIYLARNLRRDLLPSLPRVASTPSLEEYERKFQRPWIDTVFFCFATPAENMPLYGREVGRLVGIGSLLLCCDFQAEEKEKLLVNFVQVGIDLWGVVRAGHRGWPAHGGHGSGRKWPIVFAGIMLGDSQMQSPTTSLPDVKFGEDMQTIHGKGWTGATALYAGHVGKERLPRNEGWGAYEHLHPSRWANKTGEAYRRCCTSVCWVGQALAARLLHAEKLWNHDAFFDYVDRWMTEDDTRHVEEIKKATGWDFSQDWARQGQAWDEFVNDMWAKYRNNLPPVHRQ